MAEEANPAVEVSIRAPLDKLEQDLARAQLSLAQFDRVSGDKGIEQLGVSSERTDKLLAALEDQLGLTTKAQGDFDDASSSSAEALSKQNAELVAATASYKEHADASDTASRGVTGFIGETLSAANHLKGAAAAAYVMSSTVRGIVNSAALSGMRGLATAAGTVGPAIAEAGAQMQAFGVASNAAARAANPFLGPGNMERAGAAMVTFGTATSTASGAVGLLQAGLMRLLAFLGPLALPILAIVTAWKLLSAAIKDGAEAMEKFGNRSRLFEDSAVQETIDKLNKGLQRNNGNFTPEQITWASDLNTRLENANFKIKQFMETQINLHSVGLAFQNVWVLIVEAIARATDSLNVLISKLPAAGAFLRDAVLAPVRLGARLAGGGSSEEDDPSIAARRNQMAAEAATAAARASLERERQRALSEVRTVIGLGGQTTAGDPSDKLSKIALTTTARLSAAFKDLSKTGAAAEVEKTTSQFDKLAQSMERSAAVQEAEAKAVDAGVAEHARLRAQLRLEEAARQEIKDTNNGKDLEDYADRIKKIADRFAKAAGEAAQLKLESDIKFTGDTMFFSDIDKKIAGIMRQIHGKDWQNFMNGPEASAMRFQKILEDNFQLAKSVAQDFFQTMAQGWMENVQGAELLTKVLDQVKNALLSSGIKDLFSGDPMQMAIGAVKVGAAFVINSFTQDQKAARELEKAKQAFKEMSNEVANFNSAASGFDLSQFVSAMQQIEKTGLDLIKAAVAAKDINAVVQLIQSGVKQINNQVDQFIKPKADTPGEKIAAAQNEAQQIIDELATLNAQYNLGLNRTTDILAGAAKKVADIQSGVAKTLQADINSATGKGFINDIQKLVDDTKSLRDEAAATGVDPTLIGRRFQVMAQQVIDNAQLTGTAFDDLNKLFPDLIGQVHAYTAAIDDNSKAMQEATNQTAASIVDFLNDLQGGPGSTGSPTSVYNAALSAFNANLPLAQGGNLDAQNKFVSLASNLEKAARTLYASGQNYQDVKNMILSTGLGLPSVTNTTDPVVAALRDNIKAMDSNTAATGLNTTSTTTLTGTTGAANTGVAGFTANINDSLGKIQSLAANVVELSGKVGTLALDIKDSADKIVTMAASVKDSSDKIVTLAGSVSDSSGKISTLALNVSTSSTNLLALANTLSGPAGTSQRLVDLANTIGTGGDQQLRNKLLSLATDINDSSGKITTLATNVNDSAGKIATLATNANTSATNISTLATNAGTSATNISDLAGKVSTAAGNVKTMSDQIGSSATGIGTVAGNTGLTATRLEYGGSDAAHVLHDIQDLNQTSKEQLQLLNSQLAGAQGAISNPSTISGPYGSYTFAGTAVNNTLLQALNKIVINTKVTADNTAQASYYMGGTAGVKSGFTYGVFAQGGILDPGRYGIFGEHHPQGPWIMQAGQHPVPITPRLPPGIANDNGIGWVVTKLGQLERSLMAAIAMNGGQVSGAVSKVGADLTDVTDKGSRRVAASIDKQINDNKPVAA